MSKPKHVRFRHRVVFCVLLPVIRLYLFAAYGYRCTKAPSPKTPALIFANHNCNFDPFFVASSFKMPVYFVASDHIFRLGWVSRLIRYLVAPIPIAKSQMDVQSIKDMLRIRDEGGTVCLFPEGNRSFNGRTGYIAPAAAKLAKRMKLPLVLYRIEGAYMSTPRWGKGRRRGKIRGFVHSTVTSSELATMPVDELCERIRSALDVDAFAMQREKPVAYRYKARALYLQRVLYICPNCRALASITTERHTLSCRSCGFAAQYDAFGFFQPTDSAKEPPFEDIYTWDIWQKSCLKTIVARPDFPEYYAQTPLFSDEECELYRAERASASELVTKGRLCIYADRLEISGPSPVVFLFSDILGVNVYLSQILQLSTKQSMYDIKSKRPVSASKYVNAFYFFKYVSGGEPDGFIGI